MASFTQRYSESSEEHKKELLIFVSYVNVDAQSQSAAKTRLSEHYETIRARFDRIEKVTHYIIEVFVFPSKGEEPKLECVFQGDRVRGDKELTDVTRDLLRQENVDYKGFTVSEEPNDAKERDPFNHTRDDKWDHSAVQEWFSEYKGTKGLYE